MGAEVLVIGEERGKGLGSFGFYFTLKKGVSESFYSIRVRVSKGH